MDLDRSFQTHQSYSTDLTLNDFHLFPSLQNFFGMKKNSQEAQDQVTFNKPSNK